MIPDYSYMRRITDGHVQADIALKVGERWFVRIGPHGTPLMDATIIHLTRRTVKIQDNDRPKSCAIRYEIGTIFFVERFE